MSWSYFMQLPDKEVRSIPFASLRSPWKSADHRKLHTLSQLYATCDVIGSRFWEISSVISTLLFTETNVESGDVSKQKWNLCQHQNSRQRHGHNLSKQPPRATPLKIVLRILHEKVNL